MRTLLVCRTAPILLGLLLPIAAVAQSRWPLPDTPAGRHASALLQAIDTGDEALARALVAEHMAPGFASAMPLSAHLQQLRRMHEQLKGLSVLDLRREPGRLDLVVEANGARRTITLDLEPEEPYRIVGIRVEQGDPRPAYSFASLEALERELRAMAADDRFSGVVLLSRGGGDVPFERAYGMADRERGIPNRVDTRFNIGSIDKDFTMVAILRLVQEGKLQLDDPVGKYLQGFRPEVAERVTIRHLLRHRGGMGDYLSDPRWNEHPERFQRIEDHLALLRDRVPDFEPGTQQRYSNSGYVMLGGVVEAITGRSYDEVVREYVFVPAGMTRTSPFGPSADPNTALPYSRSGPDSSGRLVLRDHVLRRRGTPAGGSYSTARDLLRFTEALIGNRLLDARHTAILFGGFAPGAEQGARGGEVVMAGGAPGLNAAWGANFSTGALAIVLANLDPPIAEDLVPAVLQLARGGTAGPDR